MAKKTAITGGDRKREKERRRADYSLAMRYPLKVALLVSSNVPASTKTATWSPMAMRNRARLAPAASPMMRRHFSVLACLSLSASRSSGLPWPAKLNWYRPGQCVVKTPVEAAYPTPWSRSVSFVISRSFCRF